MIIAACAAAYRATWDKTIDFYNSVRIEQAKNKNSILAFF